jgi:hypothetical protein
MSTVIPTDKLVPNGKIVGKIYDELLQAITNAPLLDQNKSRYVSVVLEEIFKDVNWSESFEIPLVIICDEIITSEILIILHQWLRTKCADIENIVVVTCNHTGVHRWWKKWCDVYHQQSFSIIELSLGYSYSMNHPPIRYPLPPIPSANTIQSKKNILYYFNVYGGTYPTLERLYIVLRMLELRDYGVVEYLGELYDKQKILDYIENITYFKNQKEIDKVTALYDQYVINHRLLPQQLQFDITSNPTKNEPFFSGHQLTVDNHCFANVVRETMNFEPYNTVTEKTLRSFLHHLAVIPTGYQAVADLEVQGFWFPHDVIDYGYQNQPDHSCRMTLIINAIQRMIDKFSINDLNQYYQENLKHFHHNTKLVYDIVQDPLITYRKLNP